MEAIGWSGDWEWPEWLPIEQLPSSQGRESQALFRAAFWVVQALLGWISAWLNDWSGVRLLAGKWIAADMGDAYWAA